MNMLGLFRKKKSAPTARERLQVLLSHERAWAGQSDLVTLLREEILAVIAKHVDLDGDRIQVSMDRDAHVSKLEIEIEIPLSAISHAA